MQSEKEELEETLKSKYQPKIKEQKDIIALQEYELEKLERQYQQDMLDLENWKKRPKQKETANFTNWKSKNAGS